MIVTKLGTRTGRILHVILLVSLAGVALIAAASVAGVVWTSFNPQTLWNEPLTARYADGVVVEWPNTSRARYMLCGVGLLLSALLTAMILPLVGLIRSASRGDPFVAANVRRLHGLAAVFAVIAILQLVLPRVMPIMVGSLFGVQGVSFGPGPIMMAMIVLVLAEVFHEGVRLREDNEGTI